MGLMISEKKMTIEWKTNFQLEARNEKGLSVRFDAPLSHRGEETALSPMENVLASLAACSSFHVLTILEKKRQKVTKYYVEATAQRREEPALGLRHAQGPGLDRPRRLEHAHRASPLALRRRPPRQILNPVRIDRGGGIH